MRSIDYRTGDATAPVGPGNRIIAHVCNDIGAWGKGFVTAISKRWPQPEAAYRAWYDGRATNDFALGAAQRVQVEPQIGVANLIGQRDIRRAMVQGVALPPVRYEAIEAALGTVAAWALEWPASVHMPRIGCGLAGGSWDVMGPIVERTLSVKDIRVVVYDLAPVSSPGIPERTK